MNKRKHILNLLLVTVLFLFACNLPSASQGEGASLTAAAQTVEALLSATPAASTTNTNTPNPAVSATVTVTPQPGITNTPVASVTSNCNQMEFVSDITIPDGTVIAPAQNFTKTWRLRNIGTCPWTSSYAVVFSDGNSMNGPSSQALTGAVNPGQTVDISVNLTAPAAPGEYRGNWKLRDASGVLFGRFYVEIKSQAAAAPATSTSVIPPLPPAIAQTILSSLGGESGQVRSDGTVLNPPNTGDTDANVVAEAFVSFDMSSIPSGASITKVVVDFSSYDVLGNPWSLGDGCVRSYVQSYGSVDAGDFYSGDPTGAITRWCGSGELSSVFEDSAMKGVVQSAVGSSRLQLRIQFRTPTTNSNGVADMIRFGTVKLTVTYQ